MKYYVAKEDVVKYPLIQFSGNIYIVDTLKEVIRCCEIISESDVVGFDTETKPSFKKGIFYDISLIQFSVKNDVFLFRINKTGLHPKIIDILVSPNITKVGIDLNNDLSALKKIQYFEPLNFIDLNAVALKNGFKSIGAVKLSILLLGHRISKKQRISDWSADKLSDSQIKYAAIDAWICPQILDVFRRKSFKV